MPWIFVRIKIGFDDSASEIRNSGIAAVMKARVDKKIIKNIDWRILLVQSKDLLTTDLNNTQ